MQIFVGCREVDYEGFGEDPRPKLLLDIKGVIESDFGFNFERSDIGNAGRGADWVGLLIWFGHVAYAIFTQGKVINENIEGWIGIAGKLKKLIETISQKFGPVRIDQEVARVLALGKVLESKDVKSVELSHEHKVSLDPLEWREEGNVDREPEAYYYFFFHVNREGDSQLETIMVKSSGEIMEHNKRSLGWWDF